MIYDTTSATMVNPVTAILSSKSISSLASGSSQNFDVSASSHGGGNRVVVFVQLNDTSKTVTQAASTSFTP